LSEASTESRLPARPLREVSLAEREIYERDGVVCLRGIFPAGWLEFLAGAIEEAMANPGPHAEDYERKDGTGRFFGDLEMAERLPSFRRFVLESPAAEIAGRLMGASRIHFFYDQLLVKEPGTSARTPWHQDQPYWAVSGRQVCSLWLPLDPVPENVSVEYVRGSHRWPEFNPAHFADGSPYANTGLPALPDIEAERSKYDIARFEMRPGDVLAFQAMIVHGAPGNSGSHRRRALSTRWTGDDARYCVRRGEVSIPTSDPGLGHGDRLDCERFPLVWKS
jgi:ectoine hydroxylase-related dioxygenase (phytanoyl-CoA dioxygenase family)